ncbi:MAG: hypothetical protein M1820_004724 [Bogoriella megaspora]|nr:MAG: hypothetical protein M1820_004724 [Bogoriella megaspora]
MSSGVNVKSKGESGPPREKELSLFVSDGEESEPEALADIHKGLFSDSDDEESTKAPAPLVDSNTMTASSEDGSSPVASRIPDSVNEQVKEAPITSARSNKVTAPSPDAGSSVTRQTLESNDEESKNSPLGDIDKVKPSSQHAASSVARRKLTRGVAIKIKKPAGSRKVQPPTKDAKSSNKRMRSDLDKSLEEDRDARLAVSKSRRRINHRQTEITRGTSDPNLPGLISLGDANEGARGYRPAENVVYATEYLPYTYGQSIAGKPCVVCMKDQDGEKEFGMIACKECGGNHCYSKAVEINGTMGMAQHLNRAHGCSVEEDDIENILSLCEVAPLITDGIKQYLRKGNWQAGQSHIVRCSMPLDGGDDLDMGVPTAPEKARSWAWDGGNYLQHVSCIVQAPDGSWVMVWCPICQTNMMSKGKQFIKGCRGVAKHMSLTHNIKIYQVSKDYPKIEGQIASEERVLRYCKKANVDVEDVKKILRADRDSEEDMLARK